MMKESNQTKQNKVSVIKERSFRNDRRHRYVGKEFGIWTVESWLGEGGNGSVWLCKNEAGLQAAIKVLTSTKEKPYQRFRDEVVLLDKIQGLPGVIPMWDKHLPEFEKGNIPYYVMPVAQSATTRLYNAILLAKVEAIISIANVIEGLHAQQTYHRDIKPANILFLDGMYCLADFGLADFPEKQTGSFHDEVIGPYWTMAPEMKRTSSSADFSKADVYSLAKTLYIFLTKREKCFDGKYNADSINDLQSLFPSEFVSPIENLLIAATDDDPDKRPNIRQFIDYLEYWHKLYNDFHSRNQKEWLEAQVRVMGSTGQSFGEWTDPNEIIKVIKKLCRREHINHTLFPNHGGLDLLDARRSYEVGCIELDFEGIDIIKPKRLIYQSFGVNGEWNYFRLELDDLAPLDLNGSKEYELEEGCELISEITPGEYHAHHVLQSRSYDLEIDLKDWRPRYTRRWFRGAFLIVGKSSPYNLLRDTYDGRHNQFPADQFREYIRKLSSKIQPWYVEQNKMKFVEPSLEPEPDANAKIYWCKNCHDYLNENGFKLSSAKQKAIRDRYYNGEIEEFEIIIGKCCKNKQSKNEREHSF